MSAVRTARWRGGFPTAPGFRIRWGQERRRVHELLLEFGVDIDPDVPIGRLKPAERTAVAIVRALQDWEHTARLLVLDEATASLPPPEVAHLFSVIRQVTAKGIGVVYVSHRLEEVFEIADQVTVIRDGRNVATKRVAELDHDELVSLMIGRSVDALFAEPPPPSSDIVLSVRGPVGRGCSRPVLRRPRRRDRRLRRRPRLGPGGGRGPPVRGQAHLLGHRQRERRLVERPEARGRDGPRHGHGAVRSGRTGGRGRARSRSPRT